MAILAAGSATLQDNQAVVRHAGLAATAYTRPVDRVITGQVPAHESRQPDQPVGLLAGSFQEIPSQPHPAESGTHTKAAAAACSAGTTCILAGKTSDVESVRC